jgi:hypothetical protein
MAFRFDFKQTAGAAPTDKTKEAIKTAMRGLGKKLKELGVSVELRVTFDDK